ncbi:DNA starvation/stationary phase protection protein [Chryseobacterium joostei]|uniref:DNA starvation/stationary phase protection protein n=1 Tax=Chryseobacterium joostei TaxID=112234 RepID=A0A1N7HSM8_9FLAO|nr:MULTISPECIES: DNA starvation/stationary phase protection protein [Chryseobacterium]AZA77102.1 DNA starvation/stationary phase protection protein [Chryseobacterium sp. G0186]AZA99288.1 DNA starvation/stationary phase protection protein [Chryseobacterium joostei]SIS27710.1 starvation-inducible DNA-binding protein [Chryseobacterium joostei]
MKIQIGIANNHRQAIADQLIKILADENILYTKTKNAHWNVEGADCYGKHVFFETQYKQLDDIINSIAERIRSLGHVVPATLQSYLRLTHFTEQIEERHNGQAFITELLQDHESLILILCEYIMSCKDDLHDIATGHFITRLLEIHQKMAWLLRSHIIE